MYKIGEAARLLGLSTEALRYYERKEMCIRDRLIVYSNILALSTL